MLRKLKMLFAVALFALPVSIVWADEYSDTVSLFKNAGQSGTFFQKSRGYAIFPNVGKAGVGVGGAYGKGRVYENDKHIGDTSLSQLSVGLQLGGQGYSQIIFFEDERALKEFTSGNFEFGAEASAIAITASAGAKASSTGSSAGAAGGKKDATTAG